MKLVFGLSADGAEVEPDAARTADAADRRRLGEYEFACRKRLGDGLYLVDEDVDLLFRSLALVPVVETDERSGHVLGRTPQRRFAAVVGDALHAGNLKHLLVERIHDINRLVVGLAFRKTAVHGNVAAILLREERLGHLAGRPPHERDYACEEQHGEQSPAHKNAYEEKISAPARIHRHVERSKDLERLFARRLENVGAQNRREYERHHRRKAKRYAHGDGELDVHHADHAGIERKRHVAGERHESSRDDRAGNLSHRLGSGFLG